MATSKSSLGRASKLVIKFRALPSTAAARKEAPDLVIVVWPPTIGTP